VHQKVEPWLVRLRRGFLPLRRVTQNQFDEFPHKLDWAAARPTVEDYRCLMLSDTSRSRHSWIQLLLYEHSSMRGSSENTAALFHGTIENGSLSKNTSNQDGRSSVPSHQSSQWPRHSGSKCKMPTPSSSDVKATSMLGPDTTSENSASFGLLCLKRQCAPSSMRTAVKMRSRAALDVSQSQTSSQHLAQCSCSAVDATKRRTAME
jgi:hypothetical protein